MERLFCGIVAFLEVLADNIPIVLTTLIALVTIITNNKRDIRSQQYSFRKDFYLKHYDSMLKLFIEYEATFNCFDYLFKVNTWKDLHEGKDAEEMIKQAMDDMRNVDVVRNKIDLMINQDNPHAVTLTKALNTASWGIGKLLILEASIKAYITTSKDTDEATDKPSKADATNENADNNTGSNYFNEEIDNVRKMREHLQGEAKKYLAAERNLLLSRKGR